MRKRTEPDPELVDAFFAATGERARALSRYAREQGWSVGELMAAAGRMIAHNGAECVKEEGGARWEVRLEVADEAGSQMAHGFCIALDALPPGVEVLALGRLVEMFAAQMVLTRCACDRCVAGGVTH